MDAKKEIKEIRGVIKVEDRKWYQLYKKGWCKQTDGFGKLLWIRFDWDFDFETK